jgi:hypothetical protein
MNHCLRHRREVQDTVEHLVALNRLRDLTSCQNDWAYHQQSTGLRFVEVYLLLLLTRVSVCMSGADAIPCFDGFDCAEAILLDANPTPPAAVRTARTDKDNTMTIRIILLFVNMIL